MPETWSTQSEQWEIVCQTLPVGWREKARELKAMRRQRGEIQEPETLLRILMIHLLDGCSLRETATRAAYGKLAQVSDVALLKRLRACGEWFRWIGGELMRQYVGTEDALDLLPGRKLRLGGGRPRPRATAARIGRRGCGCPHERTPRVLRCACARSGKAPKPHNGPGRNSWPRQRANTMTSHHRR